MTIHCPYCQRAMDLKGEHAGRFTPKCTVCHGQFILTIPQGANAAPIVAPIPGREPNAQSIEDALGLDHDTPVRAVKKKAVAAAAPTSAKTVAPPVAAATATIAPPPTPAVKPPAEHPQGATGGPPKSPSRVSATVAPQAAPTPPSVVPPIGHADVPPLPPAPAVEGPVEDIALTGTLGGYEVQQKLGQGGMGAVFLARQVSLDRNVALKVLAPKLAADPSFISRFTREAYAAAQLSHHNVVQIHDIGLDREINFFSMEFVEGQTLAGMVREHGKLDPEVAAGYILQAARGLKFAHDHGMVHRDVKPENLLLSEEGIVKVADLGLVKRADAEETKPASPATGPAAASPATTQLNISMGTPSYMPPEQAVDAAHVDQRADIYALGCTFYDLLVGHPPFAGKTVVEVITKHAIEPVTPPDRIAKHVPAMLSTIVLKMMAKRKEDRYQTMGQVIEALEGFLGIDSGKPFSPKDEHVRALEIAVQRFNESKFANLRTWIIRGFVLVALVGAIVCALPAVGQPFIAGGLLGFAVLSTLIYQATIGITQRTVVFRKFRQLIFGASIVDWVKFLVVVAAGIGILIAFNLHWSWLTFGIVAAMAAIGFHFSIDLMAKKEQSVPVTQVEGMLKQMRLRGLDENALRNFVCRYSGQRWEAFYEALFGYDAKMEARRLWGQSDRGRLRPKYGAWRDSFIAWVDHKQQARKEARERKMLAKLEAKALAAKGIDMMIANKQAQKNAERLVHKASVMKTASDRSAATALPASGVKPTLENIVTIRPNFLHDDDDHHEDHKHESYLKRRYGGPLDLAFGKQVRFVLAAIILGGFALWWNVNGGWEVKKEASNVMAASVDPTELAARKVITSAKEQIKTAELESKDKNVPLRMKMVPDAVCDMIGSWNGGVAGVILIGSLFLSGKLLGLTVIIGALVAMAAHKFALPMVSGQAWLAALIGLGIALGGMLLFRERKGF